MFCICGRALRWSGCIYSSILCIFKRSKNTILLQKESNLKLMKLQTSSTFNKVVCLFSCDCLRLCDSVTMSCGGHSLAPQHGEKSVQDQRLLAWFCIERKGGKKKKGALPVVCLGLTVSDLGVKGWLPARSLVWLELQYRRVCRVRLSQDAFSKH